MIRHGCSREREFSARRRGMSLVEMMVAMVILSFGLLGVAGLQVRAIKEGNGGQRLSTASAIARNRVEEMNRVAWNAAELELSRRGTRRSPRSPSLLFTNRSLDGTTLSKSSRT